jgi:hypothetical protein
LVHLATLLYVQVALTATSLMRGKRPSLPLATASYSTIKLGLFMGSFGGLFKVGGDMF